MFFETGLGFVGVFIAWVAGISLRSQLVFSWIALGRGLAASLTMVVGLLLCYWSPWTPLRRLRRQVEHLVHEFFADSRWYELAMVSAAAGIGEEFLFRGALQTMFIEWTNPWFGVLVAALLFGAAHAMSLAYFLAATVIGCFLGWLAFAYQDLLAPVLAHAIYDFAALTFIKRKLALQSEE